MNELKEWHGVALAGIDFTYPHKTQCPKCASEGGDRSGDNLHIYGLDDDGKSLGAYCFRCNFTVPSEEFLAEVGNNSFSGNFDKKGESMISKRDEEKLKEKSLTPEQLAEIYEKTSDSLTTKYRGLDGNVAKELGVRWEYNADGSLKAMYFPAYVKDNGEMKVTGYKVRDLPKNFYSLAYVGKCNLMGGMTSQVAETLIVVAGECFTDETEVMTEHGFVSFSELKQDDKVLQINESMQGEFVKPVAIIRKNFTGKLVGHETLTTHTLTTPNHNLVFKTIKGKVFKQKASDKVSSGWLIPKTTTVSGNGINLSNDEIKLVLAVCADGSLRNRVVGNNAVHLSFIKERKVNRLKGILERLKISYTSYVNTYDNGKTYTTFNFILPDYIVDKNIPKSWLVDATLQQRLFILEELRYWDGHYQEKKRSMEFTSKHLDECLFVQELAHTAGLYASVRHRTNQYGEWYRCCVSYSMKNATTQSLYTYEKNYSGNVYCVTVPTGMILTRHKGKVTACGNCDLITATQAMKSADKYRKSYNIVTSLTGESSTADDLKNHYEWVNKHQKIIICMDNDSAGEKAFDEIKKVVDNDKLYKANLRHKDLNDYLKNGDGDKLVNDLYWQAIPYENYGLIGSSDLFDKALDMVALERIPLPPFLSGLDEAFSGGIALGEVVNIVSSVSTGKSVFVNEIVLDWIINSPYKMMIISLEDNGGSYLIKIASRIINNKIMTLRTADERKQALIDHRDEIDKYLVDEDGYNRFIFKEDSTSDLDIMKRAILQAIKVFGVRIILLDPLMSLIGSKSLDEQVKWMEFEEETRRIHNITFINVAHTRKSASGSQAHSEGGSISEEDIKGSQQISATATTNIILRRNKMAEDEIERNTTYVDITKNRTIGITGRDLARIYYSNKHHTLFDFNYAEQNNFFNDMSSERLKEVIDFNKATPVSSSLDDVEELNDAMDASSLVSSIIPMDNIPDW